MFRVIFAAIVLSLVFAPVAIADESADWRKYEAEKLMKKGDRLRISGIVLTSVGIGFGVLVAGVGLVSADAYDEENDDDFGRNAIATSAILAGIGVASPYVIAGGPCWAVGNKRIEEGKQMLGSIKSSNLIPAPTFGYAPETENPIRFSLSWSW